MEQRLNKSKQTEEWLSGQLEDMRARLQQSEDELQAYARSSGLLFASTSGDSAGTSDISGSRLSQLQTELSAAQNDRVSAQSRMKRPCRQNRPIFPMCLMINSSPLNPGQDY